MGRKRSAGLRLREGIWHIEKRVLGVNIFESCHTSDEEEAEAYLAKRVSEVRNAKLNGERPRRLWREAVIKYLNDHQHKASLEDEKTWLRQLDKHLMEGKNDLYLDQVHDGTLEAFKVARRKDGVKPKTINLALGVARRILNLAARSWRDKDTGLTWLASAPLVSMEPMLVKMKAYPLDVDEERRLFKELPDHLAEMALYKVNTGSREQEVCGLRWSWEVPIPELKTSVFVLEGDEVKNREDRIHVLNEIATSVIESKRRARPVEHLRLCEYHNGQDCNCAFSFVFTYMGYRVAKMHSNAWRRAWKDAGLPVGKEFKKGVHNLKHTCGRRLRAAGVSKETRQVLLGHKNGDITTHYSAAELQELIDAANAPIRRLKSGKSPALTLIKRKTDVKAA